MDGPCLKGPWAKSRVRFFSFQSFTIMAERVAWNDKISIEDRSWRSINFALGGPNSTCVSSHKNISRRINTSHTACLEKYSRHVAKIWENRQGRRSSISCTWLVSYVCKHIDKPQWVLNALLLKDLIYSEVLLAEKVLFLVQNFKICQNQNGLPMALTTWYF